MFPIQSDRKFIQLAVVILSLLASACNQQTRCPRELDRDPQALSADINDDGIVNALDQSVIISNFNQALAGKINGDINQDGFVNQLDLNLYLEHEGDVASPGGFCISTPTGSTHNTTPTIKWETSKGAENYKVSIARDPGCADIIGSTDIPSTQSAYQIPNLSALSPGTYYACVDASRGSAIEPAANQGLAFEVDTQAPGEFSVFAPPTPVRNAKPTITWSTSLGALVYRIRLVAGDNCSSETIQTNYVLSPKLAYTFKENIPAGNYSICLDAYDRARNRTTGPPQKLMITEDQNFTLSEVKGRPSPIDTAEFVPHDPKPVIRWQPLGDVESYFITIGRSLAPEGCIDPVPLLDKKVELEILNLPDPTKPESLTVTNPFQPEFSLSDLRTNGLPDGQYFVCLSAKRKGEKILSRQVISYTVNPQRVFVSDSPNSIEFTGQFVPEAFDSIEGAHWACTYYAKEYGLLPVEGWDVFSTHSVWHALLSTPLNPAKDVIPITRPVYNMHGELVALNHSDFWDGSLWNPIDYDERGLLSDSATRDRLVWTGWEINHGVFDDCGNWNSSNPNFSAYVGDFTKTDSGWHTVDRSSCRTTHRIYCISP